MNREEVEVDVVRLPRKKLEVHIRHRSALRRLCRVLENKRSKILKWINMGRITPGSEKRCAEQVKRIDADLEKVRRELSS